LTLHVSVVPVVVQLGVLKLPVAALKLGVAVGAESPLTPVPTIVAVNAIAVVEPTVVVAGLGVIVTVGVAAVICRLSFTAVVLVL
jgi:hypothetical protein